MNGKLMFEIPAPTTPLSFSVSMGGSTNKQRANGSSVDLNPLQEISSFAEIAEAAKEYGIMRQRIDDMGGALVFQVKKGVATYIKDKISLELQRGDLGLRRKTAEIQKRLLEIGGATRVDYLKTLNQRAEEESAILESVLKLRQSERALERLLGLDTGELERVRASIAATRN
jgi:outer membrane protein TolC